MSATMGGLNCCFLIIITSYKAATNSISHPTTHEKMSPKKTSRLQNKNSLKTKFVIQRLCLCTTDLTPNYHLIQMEKYKIF
jgi:hypothetical protein